MTGKCFIDTNILVYAYDTSEPEKQQSALSILDSLMIPQRGYISTQVLSEFIVVVTKKIPNPLTLEQAERSIHRLCQSLIVLQINEAIIIEALRGVKVHHLSFWDSMIWATAKLNQVGIVLCEDFSTNSVIEGIRFVNPLSSI
jgi:predicted nucleic acid-binding protein